VEVFQRMIDSIAMQNWCDGVFVSKKAFQMLLGDLHGEKGRRFESSTEDIGGYGLISRRRGV
jgi:hypothetical protein